MPVPWHHPLLPVWGPVPQPAWQQRVPRGSAALGSTTRVGRCSVPQAPAGAAASPEPQPGPGAGTAHAACAGEQPGNFPLRFLSKIWPGSACIVSRCLSSHPPFTHGLTCPLLPCVSVPPPSAEPRGKVLSCSQGSRKESPSNPSLCSQCPHIPPCAPSPTEPPSAVPCCGVGPAVPTCLIPGPQSWGEGAGWGVRRVQDQCCGREFLPPSPTPGPGGGHQGGIQRLLQPLALTKAHTATARAGSPPHVPTHCCDGVPACSHGMPTGQRGLCESQTTALWSAREHSQGWWVAKVAQSSGTDTHARAGRVSDTALGFLAALMGTPAIFHCCVFPPFPKPGSKCPDRKPDLGACGRARCRKRAQAAAPELPSVLPRCPAPRAASAAPAPDAARGRRGWPSASSHPFFHRRLLPLRRRNRHPEGFAARGEGVYECPYSHRHFVPQFTTPWAKGGVCRCGFREGLCLRSCGAVLAPGKGSLAGGRTGAVPPH